MLEVDDDSRLGRELIAGGTRYHAHFVPDEDAIADFYSMACEKFEAAGMTQYEISNFARAGIRVAAQPEVLDPAALSRLRRRCAFHAVLQREFDPGRALQHRGLTGEVTLPVRLCRRR